MNNKTENGWIDKPLDGFYAHIYSNGHSVLNLFDTDEDHIFGMNLLPVTANTWDVKLLMIQLMDTHFHIIVRGDPADCEKMCFSINTVLMKRIKTTGRNDFAPAGIDISIDRIYTETELKNKIIYVYRNSIAAGYSLAPWHYRWGPGDILFIDHKKAESDGHLISDTDSRSQRAMFHTRATLPAEWRYDDNGMILPHSYLDWKYVESLFGSIRAFLAFLYQRKDVEVQIDRECSAALEQKLSEQSLKKEVRELCKSMFGRAAITKASTEERIAIAQKLWADRRTYSITKLARLTLLDRNVLSKIL
jgi:hypothetical protein